MNSSVSVILKPFVKPGKIFGEMSPDRTLQFPEIPDIDKLSFDFVVKYEFSAIIIVLKQIIKVISKRFARHKQKKLKEMEMTKIDIWIMTYM